MRADVAGAAGHENGHRESIARRNRPEIAFRDPKAGLSKLICMAPGHLRPVMAGRPLIRREVQRRFEIRRASQSLNRSHGVFIRSCSGSVGTIRCKGTVPCPQSTALARPSSERFATASVPNTCDSADVDEAQSNGLEDGDQAGAGTHGFLHRWGCVPKTLVTIMTVDLTENESSEPHCPEYPASDLIISRSLNWFRSRCPRHQVCRLTGSP